MDGKEWSYGVQDMIKNSYSINFSHHDDVVRIPMTMDIMPMPAQNIGQAGTAESAPNWQITDPVYEDVFNPEINQATINLAIVDKKTLNGAH
jgi:hypothetical protein